LQSPYYTGQIKNEMDRVWLAAMIDAEGNICVSEYSTGERTKSNIYITITNSSVPIIDKCIDIFPQDKRNVYSKDNPVNMPVFRWDVERMGVKAQFLCEIYPYLVAKRKQAILGYTFLTMQMALHSKKRGYLAEQQEQRTWIASAVSRLNHGENVDLPEWAVEPPSLYEPGFYLRQDIIWHKPNPMPESVKDRCTKAHEYVFLLSKSARYFYDCEAVREPIKQTSGLNFRARARTANGALGGDNKHHMESRVFTGVKGANRRSVWTIPTKPYKGAHFATFPPALVEPCILAGCPAGGTVIDPFFGSGTVGAVAVKHGRDFVGIELNPEYIALAEKRIRATQPPLMMAL